ncbi:unnamed protein product [Microthlaspi erraticum]|uniref:Uncharacterized protein n=1 Tax=Microthlaspi erraticum TaxID=1685480 RepID=A0A6D2KDK2_9BRAS|nr:unnamed protein product [Microthlaspi erraticum]
MRTLRFKRRRSQSTLKLKRELRKNQWNQSLKQRESAAEPSKTTRRGRETLFVPPPFKPMLPFPTRFKKQMAENAKVFDQQMSEINLKIPFIDALMMIKPYQKFLKDAILERTKEV